MSQDVEVRVRESLECLEMHLTNLHLDYCEFVYDNDVYNYIQDNKEFREKYRDILDKIGMTLDRIYGIIQPR